MFGRKNKGGNAVAFHDPSAPSVIKITLEDGSYKKIMVQPFMRVSDVIEAVLSKTNQAQDLANYAVAVKEKGVKTAPFEVPHTESARALVGPDVAAVYLREVVTATSHTGANRKPVIPLPEVPGASHFASQPASEPQSKITPQQSYDMDNDPMYDQIPDILAGKGGGEEYMYDERTMPAFKAMPSIKSPTSKSPPKSPLVPASLHWGQSGGDDGGNEAQSDVPDLSSASLYAETPPAFIKTGTKAAVVDTLQYDETTLPAFKGDIPPPPPSPPPEENNRFKTARRPAPRANSEGEQSLTDKQNPELYSVIDGGSEDDGEWEDCEEVGATVLIKVFIAKRSYTAADDDELSFEEGDQIFVARQDDDGWWLAVAQADGSVGYVPNTFLMDEPIDEFTQPMPEELVGMDDDEDEDEEDGAAAGLEPVMEATDVLEGVVSPPLKPRQANPSIRGTPAVAAQIRRTAPSIREPRPTPRVHDSKSRAGSTIFIPNTVTETDADTGTSAASMLPPPPAAVLHLDDLPPPPPEIPEADFLPPPPPDIFDDDGANLPPPPPTLDDPKIERKITARVPSPSPPPMPSRVNTSLANELITKVQNGNAFKNRGIRRQPTGAFSQETVAGFSRMMSVRKTAKKPTGKVAPPVAAKPLPGMKKLLPANVRSTAPRIGSVRNLPPREPSVRPTPRPRPRSVASRSDVEQPPPRPPPLPSQAPPPLPSMPPPMV